MIDLSLDHRSLLSEKMLPTISNVIPTKRLQPHVLSKDAYRGSETDAARVGVHFSTPLDTAVYPKIAKYSLVTIAAKVFS
jgi:hypothetical protein